MQLYLVLLVSMLLIIVPSSGQDGDAEESEPVHAATLQEVKNYAYYYDDSEEDESSEEDDSSEEDSSAGILSPPPPPTVQSCCPPGSRLRLTTVKGGGYSAECVDIKGTHLTNSTDVTPHLVISGHELPECSRGMQVERVGIRIQQRLTTTTTTTTTTTSSPQVLDEEEFRVVNYESSTPYGWRLATVSDVRGSYGAKMEAMEAISDWDYGIACLANNARFFGSGYDHEIQEGISCGDSYDHLGHKMIVKGTSKSSTKSASCDVDADTDYPGLDLNPATGLTSDRRESAMECRALCNLNPDCKYFGWKAHSHECWMKTGISRKVAQRGTTSGSACREERAPTHEPEPEPEKEYLATLTSSGVLEVADKKYELGTFCLASTWDEWDTYEMGFRHFSDDDEATTLTCDLCKEKALCNYLRIFYDDKYVGFAPGYEHMSDSKLMIKALIGDFESFDEFKTLVETFIKKIWNIFDADEDGILTEIVKQPEVKISSNFFLKLADFLFEKFDYDWDEVISVLDWYEFTGKKGKDIKVGRKLISLPSPVYKLYTRLDEDRDEVLSLEEIHNFLKRTFGLIDKNKDCFFDLDELITALDEAKLPKEFQLGLKLLAKQQLSIANHALNRFFEVADSNHDNVTEVEEILNFSDFDFLESEATDTLMLSSPNMGVVRYLNGDSSKYEESSVRRDEVWLETLQNIVRNQAYDADTSNIKCF